MVNFTVDEIRGMMDDPKNIRNLSVIAHVDHGKSTLTDSLIGHAGIIAQARAGDTRFMDTRKDEQDRTITIKSTAVSLHFSLERKHINTLEMKAQAAALEAKNAPAETKSTKKKKGGKKKKSKKKKGKKTKAAPAAEAAPAEPVVELTEEEKAAAAAAAEAEAEAKRIDGEIKEHFLINLIDSPGHVDFSSEVTAALRVTDGALVVVDCVEGVCVQTETVLRQAIAERIRPILFVNKLDRVFLELSMDLEDAYSSFNRAVESVNMTIATYNDELLGDVTVYPDKGTVGFGSGLHGWGFTIKKFADMYAVKFGVSAASLMNKLWGPSFYDGKRNKWSKKARSKAGENLERGFCAFVLKPIDSLFTAVMNDRKEAYTDILGKLGVKIPKDARDLVQKPLLKRIMQTWLPAAEALLEMIVNYLPSPAMAQKYRVSNLYSGPADDACGTAIANCDSSGPLMMYVSKMVPTSEKGRFYAFGRVFSGTVATGQQVRIQGPDYVPGKKKDLAIKKIQRTVLMMGRYVEQLENCPCGNIIGLVGVDQYILKSGTITNHAEAHNFVTMKYSVSPVVRRSVDVQNASDLPKLLEGLKRLAKSDPLVLCYTGPTGDHIVAGAGELHLQVCMKDLAEEFMRGAPIKISDPVVSFCETVTKESEFVCMGKSPNKHNRIYMTAQPLGDELVKAIEEKEIYENQDFKVRAGILRDDFKWDINDARRVWCFGLPPDGRANLLVNATRGVQYIDEVKDHIMKAFQDASLGGVFAQETMRGVRANLQDVTLHADSIHRGLGNVLPPARRAIYACQFKSGPAFLEPYYLCDITVPQNSISGVYSTLASRRGRVEQTVERPGTPLCQVKCFLPVLESFGFTAVLRQATSGQAFPQMIFSHWETVQGDLLQEGSNAQGIMMDVRKRKGLKYEVPDFADFYDKL